MSIEGQLVLDNEHMRTSRTVDESVDTGQLRNARRVAAFRALRVACRRLGCVAGGSKGAERAEALI